MTEQDFLYHPGWDVFRFGTPTSSIDIMINVKGLNFDECFQQAVIFEEDNIQIRTIHLNNLKEAKRLSGRAKDINDLENLL